MTTNAVLSAPVYEPIDVAIEEIAISGDGTVVASRGKLFDRKTSATESLPGRGPSLSHDGRFVAFGGTSISVLDRQTAATVTAPPLPPDSGVDSFTHASISGDGSRVAFVSRATAYDGQVFLWDVTADEVTLVGVLPNGQPMLDADQVVLASDGDHVAFVSRSRRLYVRQLSTMKSYEVPGGGAPPIGISANGGVIVFIGTDGSESCPGAFVYDHASGAITNAGWEANRPSISGDGNLVVFDSLAHVYLHDRAQGTTKPLSVYGDWGNKQPRQKASAFARIAGNGSAVVFATWSDSLLPEGQPYSPVVLLDNP